MLNAAEEYQTKQWFSRGRKHTCKLLGLFKDIKDTCMCKCLKKTGPDVLKYVFNLS